MLRRILGSDGEPDHGAADGVERPGARDHARSETGSHASLDEVLLSVAPARPVPREEAELLEVPDRMQG
jgi:hypothetical protein